MLKVPYQLKKSSSEKRQNKAAPEPIPELYNEWHSREEVEFALWLIEYPVSVLHATIRAYELDARKQAAKWKDPKKLVDFIVEKLRTKVTRGSAFIRSNEIDQTENKD